ncbi:hypothetical protein RRG08_059099, partial [Elysia crispata]
MRGKVGTCRPIWPLEALLLRPPAPTPENMERGGGGGGTVHKLSPEGVAYTSCSI